MDDTLLDRVRRGEGVRGMLVEHDLPFGVGSATSFILRRYGYKDGQKFYIVGPFPWSDGRTSSNEPGVVVIYTHQVNRVLEGGWDGDPGEGMDTADREGTCQRPDEPAAGGDGGRVGG